MQAEVNIDNQYFLVRYVQLDSGSKAIRVYKPNGPLVKFKGETKSFLRQIVSDYNLPVNLYHKNGSLKTTTQLGVDIIRNFQ